MKRNRGIGLPELLVSATIGLFLLGSVLSMWYFGQKNWAVDRIRTRLKVDLEVAMDRMKGELRLSQADRTVVNQAYFSGPTNNSGIGFARSSLDSDDFSNILDISAFPYYQIQYDKFVIYHTFENPSGSGKFELKRTEYWGDPMIPGLDVNRICVTGETVLTGDGAAGAAYGAADLEWDTRTVIKNVKSFEIEAQEAYFDGYSDPKQRSERVSFGSIVLDPAFDGGYHNIRFRPFTKNPASSGYNFGIDSIIISPSGCEREAEYHDPLSIKPNMEDEVLPATGKEVGFGGNQYLECTAGVVPPGLGSPATVYAEFRLFYDIYRESNFSDSMKTNTVISGDNPYVKLADFNENNWINWDPVEATGSESSDYIHSMDNVTVRNVVSPDEDSDLFRVSFQSHSSLPLQITKAYLWERDTDQNAKAAASDTRIQLYFMDSGTVQEGKTIPAGSSADSNWVFFPIESTKEYFVTFHINPGSVIYFPDTGSPATEHSYCMKDPTPSWLTTASWPGGNNRGHYTDTQPVGWSDDEFFSSPNTFASTQLESWNKTGTVQSRIYDTNVANPVYMDVKWEKSTGADITVYTETASDPEMTTSAGWKPSSGYTNSPAGFVSASERYLRFRAVLAATPYWTCIDHPSENTGNPLYMAGQVTCTQGGCGQFLIPGVASPWIDDVTIDWDGPQRVCEISCYFMKKPDYGLIRVEVDGEPLTKAFKLSLTTAEDFRGEEYSESASAVVEPRNTGLPAWGL